LLNWLNWHTLPKLRHVVATSWHNIASDRPCKQNSKRVLERCKSPGAEEMTKQAGGHDQIAVIWHISSNLALAKSTLLKEKPIQTQTLSQTQRKGH